uniref:Nef1-like protein n=1 Tax=Tetraselmis sp. GSL018 TaxID=582737 RepID=A0A061QRP1_9CHLO
MYAAIHWAAIGRAEHFWGLVLVLSVPCLAVLSAPCGLWWLPLRQQHREALRWSAALAALGAAVAGVEERVVFAAFGEYILLHPPWDWVLVTVALYGHGAVVLLHLSGALRSPPVHAMTSAGLVLCCFVACLTVGLPLAVVPAPLVSSLGLALFYRSRSMREYVLFLVGAGIAGLWFVGHHFWFLDVRVGEWWSVQRVCALLLAYTAPTVLLPGLLLSGAPRWLCGASLAAHALLLCAAEVALAGGNVAEVGEVLPAFCVAATSAVGALAARRLGASGRVPPWSAWLAQVICGAKLAVLLLPSPRQTVHVVLLAAATGLPLVLHRPSPSDAVRAKPARRPRVHPGVAAACAGAILLSVWAARHTLFAALAEASGHTLGEGAALGLLMLFAAAMLLPMVAAHFGDSMPARQAMAALVSTGAMITALRPPLPLSAVCHPDHEHHHRARWFCLSLFDGLEGITRESDDIAIYGSGIARKEHWGLWLLVLAVLAGLAAASQRRSLRGSGILGRLLLGLISGGSVGGFAALELFPGRETLQLIVLGSCLLAAVAVVLAVLPNQASPVLLPPVLLLWAALLPALLMLERSTPIPIPDNLRFFPDPRADLPRRYRMMRLASVLVTYASQSALLSLCFKLKVSRGADPGDLPEGAPAAGAAFPSLAGCGPAAAQLRGFLGSCLPSAGMSLGAYSRARHRGTGAPSLAVAGLGWLPLAGNLVTILCFLLCVALSSTMYEGSAAVALPLSSILLMLSQDPVLLPSLTLRRRYVPPLLAAVCHLTILGVHGILDVAHMQPQALGDRSPFMASAVQLACLLCALPSNALFAWYLWDWSRHGLAAPLLAAPLNLAALGLTDVPSVRLLSAIGLAAAATQWVAASRAAPAPPG